MSRAALPPFQRLLDAHGGDLWRYCRALLGPHDGDDAYQDAVLAALRSYPTLRHGDNLRSWLFTIAHHKVTDWHRRVVRRGELTLDHQTPQRQQVGADPGDGMADDGLWALVAELPPKQRAAVVQRYVGDLPYAEIGVLLECSEAAARQNVRAGLATLRSRMAATAEMEMMR